MAIRSSVRIRSYSDEPKELLVWINSLISIEWICKTTEKTIRIHSRGIEGQWRCCCDASRTERARETLLEANARSRSSTDLNRFVVAHWRLIESCASHLSMYERASSSSPSPSPSSSSSYSSARHSLTMKIKLEIWFLFKCAFARIWSAAQANAIAVATQIIRPVFSSGAQWRDSHFADTVVVVVVVDVVSAHLDAPGEERMAQVGSYCCFEYQAIKSVNIDCVLAALINERIKVLVRRLHNSSNRRLLLLLSFVTDRTLIRWFRSDESRSLLRDSYMIGQSRSNRIACEKNVCPFGWMLARP